MGNRAPEPVNIGRGYVDQWDKNYVHMPCSPKLTDVSGKINIFHLKY